MSILELKVGPVTEASICGDKKDVLSNKIRVANLKYLAKWVLRALVGGVAYDMGLDEKKAVSKIREKIFGSKKVTPMVVIKVESESDVLEVDPKIFEFNTRYILLSMGNRKVKFGNYGPQRIILELKGDENVIVKEAVELAIVSILISVIFFGFGKGSRRGQGSFIFLEKPKLNFSGSHYLEDFINAVELLRQGSKELDLEKIKAGLKGVVENAYNIARIYLEKKCLGENLGKCDREKKVEENKNLKPRFPVISKKTSWVSLIVVNKEKINKEAFKVVNIDLESLRPIDFVQMLMNRNFYIKTRNGRALSILKGGVAAELQGVYGEPMKPANSVYSYILGLPRSAIITLYPLNEEEKRNFEDNLKGVYEALLKKIDAIGIRENYKKNFLKAINNIFKLSYNKRKNLYFIKVHSGYLTVEPRASSFIISTLAQNQKIGIFTLLTTLSINWPLEILWISVHKRKKSGIIQIYMLKPRDGIIRGLLELHLDRDKINIREIQRELKTDKLDNLDKFLKQLICGDAGNTLRKIFGDYGIDFSNIWPENC